MKITVAPSAGFCFGVRDAVNMALETTAENADRPVQMLGHIVHNERVVEEIDDAGVKVLDNIEQADPGVLMIRAHGTSPKIYDQANERGMDIVDATCPLVLDTHVKIRQLSDDGYPTLVIGDHGHDEVVGISAQVADARIVANPEEVDQLGRRFRKLGVVVQSTQNIDNVNAILAKLLPRCQELRVHNTICHPTVQHQADILTMPAKNDVMVIVGSFTSANTMRMADMSKTQNQRSYQLEDSEQIEEAWFEGAQTVGVHAGASTPDVVIEEVIARLKEIGGPDTLVDR